MMPQRVSVALFALLLCILLTLATLNEAKGGSKKGSKGSKSFGKLKGHGKHGGKSSESNENGPQSQAQSVQAKGTLQCKGKPADDVKVKLYDEDHLVDDKLDSTRTDKDGKFQLSGSTTEGSNIEPKLYIYHDCEDGKPCQRRFTIPIQASFINRGSQNSSNNIFDAGIVELSTKREDETRDCIH